MALAFLFWSMRLHATFTRLWDLDLILPWSVLFCIFFTGLGLFCTNQMWWVNVVMNSSIYFLHFRGSPVFVDLLEYHLFICMAPNLLVCLSGCSCINQIFKQFQICWFYQGKKKSVLSSKKKKIQLVFLDRCYYTK